MLDLLLELPSWDTDGFVREVRFINISRDHEYVRWLYSEMKRYIERLRMSGSHLRVFAHFIITRPAGHVSNAPRPARTISTDSISDVKSYGKCKMEDCECLEFDEMERNYKRCDACGHHRSFHAPPARRRKRSDDYAAPEPKSGQKVHLPQYMPAVEFYKGNKKVEYASSAYSTNFGTAASTRRNSFGREDDMRMQRSLSLNGDESPIAASNRIMDYLSDNRLETMSSWSVDTNETNGVEAPSKNSEHINQSNVETGMQRSTSGETAISIRSVWPPDNATLHAQLNPLIQPVPIHLNATRLSGPGYGTKAESEGIYVDLIWSGAALTPVDFHGVFTPTRRVLEDLSFSSDTYVPPKIIGLFCGTRKVFRNLQNWAQTMMDGPDAYDIELAEESFGD